MPLDLTADERAQLAADVAEELDTGRYGDRFVLSRRQLLTIAGGSAGVAGLTALGVDPATAQSAAGQVGTSSEPVDTFAYDLDVQGALQRDLDAGGQALSNVGSLSTDGLLGKWPGRVMAIANGEVVASIDPANTTRPIHDACAAVHAVANGGTVLVPDGTITESAPLASDDLQKIELKGHFRESVIEFTDLTADGIPVDMSGGIADSYIDGVTISGSDAANRTGGAGLHFINNPAKAFNMGRVKFAEWIGDVVHFDTGHPYSSHWEYVDFFASNQGRNILVDSGGPAFSMGMVNFGSTTSSRGIQVTTAGADITIGSVNCFQSIHRAIDYRDASEGNMVVGQLNYEPSTDPNGDVAVVKGNTSTLIIGRFILRDTSNGTVDSAINLATDNGRLNVLSPITNGGFTVSTNLIDIASTPAEESWYFGPSSDITNSIGSTTDLVRSMATAGAGNG